MLPDPLKSRAADGPVSTSRTAPSVVAVPPVAARGPDVLDSALRRPAIRPLWLVEKEMIQEALRQSGDDVPKAATMLEISPSTIYRKLQQWKAEGAGKRG